MKGFSGLTIYIKGNGIKGFSPISSSATAYTEHNDPDNFPGCNGETLSASEQIITTAYGTDVLWKQVQNAHHYKILYDNTLPNNGRPDYSSDILNTQTSFTFDGGKSYRYIMIIACQDAECADGSINTGLWSHGIDSTGATKLCRH